MNEEENRKKEEILNKIKKLGILDIDIHNTDGSNPMNLKNIESVIEIIEKHEKEYPSEYVAAHIGLIKTVREYVWEKGDKFSRFYFDILAIVFWGLKKQNFSSKKCSDVCEKTLDIEKLYGIYKDTIKG